MLGRVDGNLRQVFLFSTGQRIKPAQACDPVTIELNSHGVLGVTRTNLDRVAAHAEVAARELDVVPVVLHVYQFAEQIVTTQLAADVQQRHHLEIILRRSQPVDARHACDHDHISTRQQRTGRGEPELFDLLVDGGIFLDERVRLWDVGFRLVVIVIADEILDGIAWEELLKLGEKLRRERFVVRDHQRRPVKLLNDIRHRKRLPAAGYSEQRLPTVTGAERFHERPNRGWLIAARLIFANELKRHRNELSANQSSEQRRICCRNFWPPQGCV